MDSEFDIDKILSDIEEEDEFSHHAESSDDSVTDTYSSEESHDDISDEFSSESISENDENTYTSNKNYSELENVPANDGLQYETVKDETIQETNLHGFTLKGSKLWNTREPYLLKVDNSKLNHEDEYFEKSFLFISQEMDDEAIRNEVKRAFAGFMRNQARNIKGVYQEFIFKLIISEAESITSYFSIPPDKKDLFIYHLGPLNMYEVVIGKLDKKVGLCYRYDNEKRRAVSFFPEEFIKFKILNWYEENINTKELPFDSAQFLDELTMVVSKKYMVERKIFSKKLDKLNYKLGPGKRISSRELIKLKGDQWFGRGNLTVFKRYLQKTMFD